MLSPIRLEDISSSLIRLKEELYLAHLPEPILQQALLDNPWYSPYYIERSLEGIRTWLEADLLVDFYQRYAQRPAEAKRIGVITAGNLPLVGFHDVLIGVLSGHQIFVRCSHQDKVLMHWIVSCWTEFWPSLRHRVKILDDLPEIDFLIATGSNNTARYLKARYRGVPHLIRQNRFSVAVLDEQTTDNQLQKLTEDVLLYNGLGCRNVSTLIVSKSFRLEGWLRSLRQYSPQNLHPHYLERVLHEKHRMKMLNASFIDGGIILMQAQKALKYASMGILNLLRVDTRVEVDNILSSHRDRLQCIVGRDTSFGKTQHPAIDDFADGVDTMALLTCL